MKIIIFFSVLLVCAYSATSKVNPTDVKDMWHQWKQNHGKAYGSGQEEAKRSAIFADNHAHVTAHNDRGAANKNPRVLMGVTAFADMTPSEFKILYNGLLQTSKSVTANTTNLNVSNITAAVDWRAQGAVNPIRNQGMCGSCWTFSAVGALEALNKIKTGKLVDLAEQNLIDCVTNDYGCNGGLPNDAFAYTAKNGINLEANYPYTAVTGTCHFNAAKAVKINKGFTDVVPNNVTQLKAAVAKQPVSVAIEADEALIQFYTGGVITTCGANIDHAVLIVGYGNITGVDAWIVRNSWGTAWGDQGYFYVSTNATANNGAGVCGILTMPSFPTA